MVTVVGFLPCEDKHRVKEALWQRFVQNLTLTRAICSASVLHLMLVGRAPMDRGTPHGVCDRRRARSAAPYLRYIARAGFVQGLSAERSERRASAMSVAERPQSRVLVAPRRVPLEARRTKKSGASDQVRSFAAKRAQSAQIHLAR